MSTSHFTALQPMHKATSLGKSSRQNERGNRVGQGLREAWQQVARAMFDTYRPELHYMRGPGPACASKYSKK